MKQINMEEVLVKVSKAIFNQKVAIAFLILCALIGIDGIIHDIKFKDAPVVMAKTTDYRGTPGHRGCDVFYQFTLNGRVYKTDGSCATKGFKNKPSVVKVQYIPENPKKNRLDRNRVISSDTYVILVAFVGAFFIIRRKWRKKKSA